MNNSVVLEVKNLKKYFPLTRGWFKKVVGYVKAVDGVSFYIGKGETVGLVGESGCGKTTLGRTILRLWEPTEGEIYLYIDETTYPLHSLRKKELKDVRQFMQIVFQDPYSSLNPRMQVKSILAEPLLLYRKVKKKELEEKIEKVLEVVGLKPEYMYRYPHEFSGGQRQRIALARALILNPKLLVADEPTSELDVSVQAQILNLMKELKHKFSLSYLLISHNLGVVRYLSERVLVMYLGKIVEEGKTEDLFSHPLHPYTEALLSAIPKTLPGKAGKKIILKGETPDPSSPPSGCPFHPRCQYKKKICEKKEAVLKEIVPGRYSSCHLAGELVLRGIE